MTAPTMTAPTTILVTGDRRWSHPERLVQMLDQTAAEARGRVRLLVGDCPTGADRHAARWARHRGVPFQVFRARWGQMAAEGRPRQAAGPLRNRAMLDALDQADGQRPVLAFHDDLGRSRGTRQCVAEARRSGYPVTLIDATGQQTLPARHRHPGVVELRRAALGYAARGIPVVPLHYPIQRTRAGRVTVGCSCRAPDCGQVGKHPLAAPVPHGVKDASTDPAVVRAWWQRFPQANIGLATGVSFDVLDVDGPQGGTALRAFTTRNGVALPRGPLVRTGSGGWHLYLAPTGLGNPSPRTLAHVDWRGRGGYVVAPPSQHASGSRYRFLRDLSAPLPQAAAALQALLEPAPAERPSPDGFRPSAGYGHPYARAALDGECQRVSATRPAAGSATPPCTEPGCGCSATSPAGCSTTPKSRRGCWRPPVAAGWGSGRRPPPSAAPPRSAWPTPRASPISDPPTGTPPASRSVRRGRASGPGNATATRKPSSIARSRPCPHTWW